MRKSITGIFCGLALLSLFAWYIQPRENNGIKTSLVWVSDDNPVRSEQIALFNKLHGDIKLNLDSSNVGMEKVIVQSLAGVGPDLFDCGNNYQLSSYIKSGVAWDITDELKKAGIDVNKQVWPAVLPLITYNGRVYGFPDNASTDAIWFNKAILDKAHIPYPTGSWTWDKFIKLAQRLTIRGENGRIIQYGLLFDWGSWQHFVFQQGGRMYSSDGRRCVIDSPEAVAGIQLMHDLIYKYKVMPTPAAESAIATSGGWGTGPITQFSAGKGAMVIGGRYFLCSLRKDPSLRLGAVELPHSSKRVFYGYGRSTLINKNSPKRYEALKYILYLAGKDYNELVNHQADGIAPVIEYSYTTNYLHDPDYPEETFNAVWRDAMKNAIPGETSPYINGSLAFRIMQKQLDLVKADSKLPSDAMKTAANQINAEIQKNIKNGTVQ